MWCDLCAAARLAYPAADRVQAGRGGLGVSILLPLLAYALLALTPLPSLAYERETLFGVGAGVLLLLFAGIHNAWDAVSFQVFVMRKPGRDDARAPD